MIYVIGDVQGCYRSLMLLLEKIQFNSQNDELWFTGDLVNRGEHSLEVLRFMKNQSVQAVLGNHDLHLIALAYGCVKQKTGDTLTPILEAPDKIELIEWLRHLPLLIYESDMPICMVHAGFAPTWTVQDAQLYAQEAESYLRSDRVAEYLPKLYGNMPAQWSVQLQEYDRLRCIVSFLTRVRMLTSNGAMDFSHKKGLISESAALYPWFAYPGRVRWDVPIVFGHWSALNGVTGVANIEALDTGCVWGGQLTALRVSDYQRFSVDSAEVFSKITKE